MLIYLHGFRSGPQSEKVRVLAQHLEQRGLADEMWCEQLSPVPNEAIASIEVQIARCATPPVLVGSSLGGFYATYLTEKLGVRSVLVNPAITPHEGLRAYLGPQKNLYTGDEYELTEEHLAQAAVLHMAKPVRMDSYLLMHTTGDELLDWRVAVDHYRGSRQVIVQGSDHGFREFVDYIDIVLAFADRAAAGA